MTAFVSDHGGCSGDVLLDHRHRAVQTLCDVGVAESSEPMQKVRLTGPWTDPVQNVLHLLKTLFGLQNLIRAGLRVGQHRIDLGASVQETGFVPMLADCQVHYRLAQERLRALHLVASAAVLLQTQKRLLYQVFSLFPGLAPALEESFEVAEKCGNLRDPGHGCDGNRGQAANASPGQREFNRPRQD